MSESEEEDGDNRVTVKEEQIDSDSSNEEEEEEEENDDENMNDKGSICSVESKSVNALANMLLTAKKQSKKKHNLRKQRHKSIVDTTPRARLMKQQNKILRRL